METTSEEGLGNSGESSERPVEQPHSQNHEHHHELKKKRFESFGSFYDKHYRWAFILPFVLLILSLIYLGSLQIRTGDIIYKDVSLTGGTTITVFDKNIDISKIESELRDNFPDMIVRRLSDFSNGGQTGFVVETESEASVVKAELEKVLGYSLVQDNSSIEFSQKNISQGFYQQLRVAIIIAFICMTIVVFIIFRTFVPGGAIVLCAFADMIMTVAVADLFGMRLSTAGIIAFLLLIGYSVDTDILLTSRVLKEKDKSINARIWGAYKTGMTMTLTAISAVFVSLILVYSSSDVLRQIFSIIMIGLFFDIVNTWLTNAAIIKWYAEKKEKVK